MLKTSIVKTANRAESNLSMQVKKTWMGRVLQKSINCRFKYTLSEKVTLCIQLF